jgi:colanic acid biosynthesis glycosyl transferase WcaI
MRILIISQYFWPENFRINDLVFALKDRGHEVTVLTGMPNYPAGKIYKGYSFRKKRRDNVHGISVIRVPIFARRSGRSWQLAVNYFSFVATSCFLGAWMLRDKSFDIVFTYQLSPATVGITGILMKNLKKAPMFFWVQDLWPESLSATGAIKSSSILSAVSCMMKKIYQGSDRILVQSKGFIEPVVAIGAERNKIAYLPNWAEPLYQPVCLEPGAAEREKVPSGGFVVMFAGNLGIAQSLDTIIGAAEKLKDENIYWVFLGDGRRRAWLENIVVEQQLDKVCLLGSHPIEAMPAYFSLADVMLVTLKDDPIMATTIPGKMQSYMACGKPIIGALNGAGATVIEESLSGYCVEPGDIDELSRAVLDMSRLDNKKRREMGAFARYYYEKNFDREMLICQLEGWMEEVVR